MGDFQLPTYRPGGRGGTAEIFATVLGALKQGAQRRRSREEAELERRLKAAETNKRAAEEYARNHPEDPLAAEGYATANEQYRAMQAEAIQHHTPKKAGPLQQILRNLGLDFGKGRGKAKGEERRPMDERLPGGVLGPPTVPGRPTAVTAREAVPVPGAAGPAGPPAIPPAAVGAAGLPQVPAVPVAPAPTVPAAIQAPTPSAVPPTAEPEPTTSAEYAARQARRAGVLGEAEYTGRLAELQRSRTATELERKVIDGTATPQEHEAYDRMKGISPYAEGYRREIDEATKVLMDPNASPEQKATAQRNFDQASQALSAGLGYYVRPPTPMRPAASIQEAMVQAGIAPDRQPSSLTTEEMGRLQVVVKGNALLEADLARARAAQARGAAAASTARATGRNRVVRSRAFQSILTNLRAQMAAERDPVKGIANLDEARRRAWAQYEELRRRHPEAELPEGRAYALKLYDGSPNPQARTAADDIEVVLGVLAAEEGAGATPLPPPSTGAPRTPAAGPGQVPPGWTP